MSDGIQVVVITGASSGLGESTARYLAKLGATVILGARRKDRLDAIVKDIEATGGKALAVTADVTNAGGSRKPREEGCRYLRQDRDTGEHAGIMPIAPLALLKGDEWDRIEETVLH